MQLVMFDTAEIENRQEKLSEYKRNIKNLIQEMDSNLQSLIFDTKKVMDDLCYNSAVRSSDDGALGKINYVLSQMPQRIGYINLTLARVKGTLEHWKNIAENLKEQIEALDAKIQSCAEQLDKVLNELNSLPDGYWYTYTVTDSDGATEVKSEWCDPWESERKSLRAKSEVISNRIESLRQERDNLQSKFNTARRNCDIALNDIENLNSFLARCNAILSTAKKDETHINETLKSLAEIIESLKKYKEKLAKFNDTVFDLTKKADKILCNAMAAIGKLKAVSYKHIPDFKDLPMQIKFDIDDCKKYKNNGDEFNETIEELTQYIALKIANISEWNDSNKSQAMETILSHAESMSYIVKFYDDEMDFLKKQIAILTDYYNAIE